MVVILLPLAISSQECDTGKRLEKRAVSILEPIAGHTIEVAPGRFCRSAATGFDRVGEKRRPPAHKRDPIVVGGNQNRRNRHRLEKRSAEEMVAGHSKRLRKTVEKHLRLGESGRADANQQELQIVEGYLPQPLSREEIKKIVANVVSEQGFTSPKQRGQVMRMAMGPCGDRVDGRAVQAIARELLPEQ